MAWAQQREGPPSQLPSTHEVCALCPLVHFGISACSWEVPADVAAHAVQVIDVVTHTHTV